MSKREVRHTTCYMCACRCGVRVTLEDDKIRFVQGTPNHPVNRGVLCGKGNAAVMKQLSPAKLKSPLLRRFDCERGEGVFEEISWDRALSILTERLSSIRSSDPNKLAFFTGRDQMQGFTGLWARQFGTMNWAAHGGFCSVNMAAAGLLTTGFSFWEFGEPDWDHARLFMMWGVAEDHASNPIKLGLSKLKSRGAKIIAINPVRTGYQAIADEWISIRPGTDGVLAMSMAHVLLSRRLIDEDFLIKYTNAPHLIIQAENTSDHGLIARDDNQEPLCFDMKTNTITPCLAGRAPALVWEGTLTDGRVVKTAFSLIMERCLSEKYSPQNAAVECGVAAKDIERLALEMAQTAFNHNLFIDTPWTDWAGREQKGFVGRPVAMHAMRGISAHANGFQTCRALHLLQALLGAIDAPGSHLAKPPYPKHPPCVPQPAVSAKADTPLSAPPLGAPRGPEDLAIDESGRPLRIDGAYSWDAPLALHGSLHTVLENASQGSPYSIDTLMIFMANLAWNSSMNPKEARRALTAKDDEGNYKIPFIVTIDAFHSEMVNYSDLVLPDTTYLERHDVISLLDRPISDAISACDAIRVPVLSPNRDVRPWQEVMVDLATRLSFPAFVDENGQAKYRDYKDFIVNFEMTPGVGFLSGFRQETGVSGLRGKANPKQWELYEGNACFYQKVLEPNARYLRFANQNYMRVAKDAGWITSDTKPMTIELYSETLRKFQLAGEGFGARIPPHEGQRQRLRTQFDPIPFWSSIEGQGKFYAVTQRPMFMYHSWDSQNAWLRQIADRNSIFMHEESAGKQGIKDGDMVWLISPYGRIHAHVKLMRGVHPDTIWTWNAIAKDKKAWGLSSDSREITDSFLMNHLIEEWHKPVEGQRFSNSDPITGQAAWYDLRVDIQLMTEMEKEQVLLSIPLSKGDNKPSANLCYSATTPVRWHRSWRDILLSR